MRIIGLSNYRTSRSCASPEDAQDEDAPEDARDVAVVKAVVKAVVSPAAATVIMFTAFGLMRRPVIVIGSAIETVRLPPNRERPGRSIRNDAAPTAPSV